MPRKQRRRGHNEGSIYQLASGRWASAMSLPNGKRKYFYGRTREEVSSKLKKAQFQQEQGLLVTARPQKMQAFLEQWLEVVKRQALKEGTYPSYRQVLDDYLIPGIGTIKVADLTPLQIQHLYADLGKRISPSTIHKVHGILRNALQYALKTGLVARNVCDLVTLPRVAKKERITLEARDAQILFASVRDHWLYPMIVLALTTGMRRGEIIGLQWDDVSFQKSQITVRRQAGWQKGRGTMPSTTKMEHEHVILLIPLAVTALKEHRAKQARVSKIVFCNEEGRYRSGSSFYQAFQKALAKAGLPPMRLHDLRHSIGSILIGLGIDIKTIQLILGHASISTTADIYVHVKPEMQEEAMKKLSALFEQRQSV